MTSQGRADYDSPWKQALEDYFKDFLLFFFPDIHNDIDWEQGYEFLDKELQQVTRDAEIGKRFADKLVKVWRLTGEEHWVLVHIEVQGKPEKYFAKRIDRYNYRITDRYNKPVVSLAILADEKPDWKPEEYRYELWGFSRVVQFPIIKLLDYRQHWSSLEHSQNPFATVVMAHLKAQETRGNDNSRKEWKFRLTRRLYEYGYSRQDVLNLFLFIDWLITLPDDLEASFIKELEQYEQEKQMQYVTSVERIAKEQGRQEGRREGLLDSIEFGLELKFGQEGLQLLPEIREIKSAERLHLIQQGIKRAATLQEVRATYQ